MKVIFGEPFGEAVQKARNVEIHAENEKSKSNITEGLIDSGYIVGVKSLGEEGFLIRIYDKVVDAKMVYQGCDCQKPKNRDR